MAWTTTAIKAKIKDLCGDPGLNDAALLIRINHFYRNVLPLEIHLKALEDCFTVNTVDGTDYHDVDPDLYFSIGPPAFIDDGGTGNLIKLRFRVDHDQFTSDWPHPAALGSHIKGLPSEVLYWQHKIHPRPVPDDIYIFATESYNKPTALGSGDAPIEDMWGPILAYDVAMDILFDQQDTDPIEGLMAARKFYTTKITTKEIMQFENVRARGSF